MDNVYYINVDVRDKSHYGKIFSLFTSYEIFKDDSINVYKVKLKNDKYIQNTSDDESIIKVYASNIIYLEEN